MTQTTWHGQNRQVTLLSQKDTAACVLWDSWVPDGISECDLNGTECYYLVSLFNPVHPSTCKITSGEMEGKEVMISQVKPYLFYPHLILRLMVLPVGSFVYLCVAFVNKFLKLQAIELCSSGGKQL